MVATQRLTGLKEFINHGASARKSVSREAVNGFPFGRAIIKSIGQKKCEPRSGERLPLRWR
jgi:hypothetical protein